MPLFLLITIFFVLFALILLVVSFGVKTIEAERKKKVQHALAAAAGEPVLQETRIFIEKPEGKEEFSVTGLLSQLPVWKRMEATLQQAGLDWSPGGVFLMMAVAAAIGVFLGTRIQVSVFREFSMLAFALALGSLPYVYVRWMRRKRLAAFEEQFPEALDFLARSMRAGHAFSVSLEMLADESPEPLGTEFRRVFHEQNLGAPIEVALGNLVTRVPLLDSRFFVSAVLLQKETGGNLAEILTKLSYVIRERFRLKGQVKAASAHGRLTALILSAMPIVTALALMVVAPSYLEILAKDPDGKYMIIGAIVAQIAGYYWMKRIITIKI